MVDQVTRLKRSHIRLMKNKRTALYSGVLMLGDSEIVSNCKTAYTDGVNKRYGEAFMSGLSDAEFNAVVMHENLHVALKHLPLHKRKWKENAKAANIAADFVVNDIIYQLQRWDSDFIKLPECALYDDKYHNWSFDQVYRDLMDKSSTSKKPSSCQQGDGNGDPLDGMEPLDEHDYESEVSDAKGNELSDKQIADAVDSALREGGMLAGKVGGDMPRAIKDLLTPQVDWREELREWVSEFAVGKDEYTFRKFDRRHIVNDLYMPTTYSDTVGDLVVCIDTSASIGQRQINEFATELASITDSVTPSGIRILWWDTMVRGDQRLEPTQYSSLRTLLKPKGGGGTSIACVPKYIKDKNIEAEAVIVFTDGYLDDEDKWSSNAPTLWLVTQNQNFVPPMGKKVKFNLD